MGMGLKLLCGFDINILNLLDLKGIFVRIGRNAGGINQSLN